MPDLFTHQSSKPPEEPAVSPSSSLPNPDTKNYPGLFASYCPYPVGVSFANQERDEKMLLFLRRHFATNVPWIIYVFLLLIAPPLFFLLNAFIPLSFIAIPPGGITIMLATYYVFVLNYAFIKFTLWFYHIGIVTQKRLIDLDIESILSFHLAETSILDIVDVSYTQKGFFQSYFKFGDVLVQTEAIKVNFEFELTPNPSAVADIVTDLRPAQKGGTKSA